MGNEKHNKKYSRQHINSITPEKIVKLLTLCNSLVLLLDYRSFFPKKEKRRNHTMKKLRYEEKKTSLQSGYPL